MFTSLCVRVESRSEGFGLGREEVQVKLEKKELYGRLVTVSPEPSLKKAGRTKVRHQERHHGRPAL
jgi:hypothetical protein